MNDFFTALSQGVRKHRYAILCAVAGLALAILFLTIGFFKALLIALFIVAGAAFGAFLDGRGKSRKSGDSFGSFDSSSFHPFDDDR